MIDLYNEQEKNKEVPTGTSAAGLTRDGLPCRPSADQQNPYSSRGLVVKDSPRHQNGGCEEKAELKRRGES